MAHALHIVIITYLRGNKSVRVVHIVPHAVIPVARLSVGTQRLIRTFHELSSKLDKSVVEKQQASTKLNPAIRAFIRT